MWYQESCFLGGIFPLLVSFAGLSGEQTIVISATGSDGAVATATINFSKPGGNVDLVCYCESLYSIHAAPQAPLSLDCTAEILPNSEQVSVSCTSSRDFSTLTFDCSLNGQPITQGCEFC